MVPSRAPESLVLLGREHADFGHVHVGTMSDGSIAAGISVGRARLVPSMRSKGDPRQPNEDALAVLRDEGRILILVADAHWGIESSHDLAAVLPDRVDRIPSDPDGLRTLFRSLRIDAPPTRSESAVALAVVDRDRQRAFGLTFGDVSVVTVDPEGARRRTMPSTDYVNPRAPGSLDPGRARGFDFELSVAQRVLVFSDGIDECHYRSPGTSIGPRHIHDVFARTGPDPETFTNSLMELALDGVDGNPGGEDNIALVTVAPDPLP